MATGGGDVARSGRPTASLVDGALDVSAYGVLRLHELFDHARLLFAPIVESHVVRGISVHVRSRDTSRGGSPAAEVEVEARTSGAPIWIRCVRPTVRAALELAAIVLRMRLAGSRTP